MATITVRNLDDDVQQRLKLRAAAHGRSMESEARAIISAAVTDDAFIVDWIAAAQSLAVELDLPARSMAREIDLE